MYLTMSLSLHTSLWHIRGRRQCIAICISCSSTLTRELLLIRALALTPTLFFLRDQGILRLRMGLMLHVPPMGSMPMPMHGMACACMNTVVADRKGSGRRRK